MRSPSALIARAVLVAAASIAALGVSFGGAGAVSSDVKSACKSDYLKHCSSHEVGSEGLKQCMRAVGEDLSTPCLVALVKAGEVTKEDIERHKAAQGVAPAQPAAAVKQAKAAPAAAKPRTAAKKVTPDASSKSAKIATAPPGKARKGGSAPAAKVAVQKDKGKANSTAKLAAAAKAKAPAPAIKAAQGGATYAAVDADGLEPPPRYTHNLCRAKKLDGSFVEFTCGLDQRCCYMQLSNQEYCRPADKPCF